MTRFVSIFILYIGILLSFSDCTKIVDVSNTNEQDTSAVILREISSCSRLWVSECEVHKIVFYSDSTKLKFAGGVFGMPGERSIVVPITVKYRAYIDLSSVRTQDFVREDGHIKVRLRSPQIELGESRIESEKIREYKSFFRDRFSESDIQNFVRQGVDEITRSLPKNEIRRIAMFSASSAIIPIVMNFGYDESQVEIEFEDDNLMINKDDLYKKRID